MVDLLRMAFVSHIEHVEVGIRMVIHQTGPDVIVRKADGGSRTLILLSGGYADLGFNISPLALHTDYHVFIELAISKGWNVIAPWGDGYVNDWESVISSLASSTGDKQKPMLLGHSAGSMAALCYAKDRPKEDYFEKILLFNCPLIYPYTDSPLRAIYTGTDVVTADTLLTLSKNDDVLMKPWWKLGSIDMMEAYAVVKAAGKITTQLLDVTGYGHSPFSPVNIAWDDPEAGLGKEPVTPTSTTL